MRHALRILFLTLALVLLGLALAPRAVPAQAAGPCDSSRAVYYWHVTRPADPYPGDAVTLVFQACRENLRFEGYSWSPTGVLLVRARMPRTPSPLDVCTLNGIEVPLGSMSAGSHSFLVEVAALIDSTDCVITRRDTVTVRVHAPPPEPTCDSLPYVTAVQIGPPVDCGDCVPGICPGERIPLHLAGWFPDGCYRFAGLELFPGPEMNPLPAPPIVRIRVARLVCQPCTMALVPWSADTTLPGLPGGEYRLRLELVRTDFCNGTPTDTTYCRESRAFAVRDSCGPPVIGPLPFDTRVTIGPPPSCDSCPPVICPGVPVPVTLSGTLPSNCYHFMHVEFLPTLFAPLDPAPQPLRIVVAYNDCMDWPCNQVEQPWSAQVMLEGLPAGAYELPVQLAVVSMCDTNHVIELFGERRPFAVLDSCVAPPGEPCVMADWVHPDAGCDDFIVPGGRARVVLTAQSSVPLAGLQGKIRVWPCGLLITNLEPVGRAAGMHVAWERTLEGASFLMFAEHGAPIGGLRCDAGTRCIEPVLAVSMVPDTDAVLPPVTHVTAGELLGADSLGGAVPQCEIMTLVVVEARVCARPSCDFNLDGRMDVRDLVMMVRCVLGRDACADTSLARLDCDRDGQLGVDDVLCCARVILHGGERDSTPGRAEPNVAVSFGEPAWETGGLRVPVRIQAADRIGAARLALSLPLEHYEVTGVEVGVGNPQWLALQETLGGQVVLGLIGLAPDAPAEEPETLDLTLHLALRSGAAAGGEIGLADLQASGPDGVTLELSTTPAAVALPLPAAMVLSAARPNPFSGATRLTLALERTAEVDVTVHDLGGRRVATLFHGPLPAGLHEFTWNGARGDGAAAAHGVYFVQARVNGERLTRKLVLLRGE
jgi:hypothetical protein